MLLVRLATPADAPAMAEIRVAAWREAYRGLVSSTVLDGFDLQDEAARFAARIGTESGRTQLVAEGPGARVLGYCMFGPDRDEDDAEVGEVYAIYVHPDRQRTGVGRALLGDAAVRLRQQGFTTLRVWALSGNGDAAAFYQRQGWVRDGERRSIDTLPAPDGSPVPEDRFSLVSDTGDTSARDA